MAGSPPGSPVVARTGPGTWQVSMPCLLSWQKSLHPLWLSLFKAARLRNSTRQWSGIELEQNHLTAIKLEAWLFLAYSACFSQSPGFRAAGVQGREEEIQGLRTNTAFQSPGVASSEGPSPRGWVGGCHNSKRPLSFYRA